MQAVPLVQTCFLSHGLTCWTEPGMELSLQPKPSSHPTAASQLRRWKRNRVGGPYVVTGRWRSFRPSFRSGMEEDVLHSLSFLDPDPVPSPRVSCPRVWPEPRSARTAARRASRPPWGRNTSSIVSQTATLSKGLLWNMVLRWDGHTTAAQFMFLSSLSQVILRDECRLNRLLTRTSPNVTPIFWNVVVWLVSNSSYMKSYHLNVNVREKLHFRRVIPTRLLRLSHVGLSRTKITVGFPTFFDTSSLNPFKASSLRLYSEWYMCCFCLQSILLTRWMKALSCSITY